VFGARCDVRLPFAQLRVIIWMVAEAEADLILDAGVICGCATPLWSPTIQRTFPRLKKSAAVIQLFCNQSNTGSSCRSITKIQYLHRALRPLILLHSCTDCAGLDIAIRTHPSGSWPRWQITHATHVYPLPSGTLTSCTAHYAQTSLCN